MELLLIIGFVALFCSVALWLFLCFRLFKALERNHPEKFQAMGSPDLGENNTLAANVALFRFLYHKEWLVFDNSPLAGLASFMRRLMIGLFACFLLIFLAAPILATRYT